MKTKTLISGALVAVLAFAAGWATTLVFPSIGVVQVGVRMRDACLPPKGAVVLIECPGRGTMVLNLVPPAPKEEAAHAHE